MAISEIRTRGNAARTPVAHNGVRPKLRRYFARAAALTILGAAAAIGAQTAPAVAVPNDACSDARIWRAYSLRMLDNAHAAGDQHEITAWRSNVFEATNDVLNNC